jgi:N utilization substance protein B
MGSRRKSRILAVQALYSWEMTSCDPGTLYDFSWRSPSIEEDTLTFARLLVAGTLENIDQVDEQIKAQLEHWDFSRLARVDLAILRVSAYQLLYQPDIPDSVAIDEAIGIAKEFAANESYRFINGVLDGIRKRSAAS